MKIPTELDVIHWKGPAPQELLDKVGALERTVNDEYLEFLAHHDGGTTGTSEGEKYAFINIYDCERILYKDSIAQESNKHPGYVEIGYIKGNGFILYSPSTEEYVQPREFDPDFQLGADLETLFKNLAEYVSAHDSNRPIHLWNTPTERGRDPVMQVSGREDGCIANARFFYDPRRVSSGFDSRLRQIRFVDSNHVEYRSHRHKQYSCFEFQTGYYKFDSQPAISEFVARGANVLRITENFFITKPLQDNQNGIDFWNNETGNHIGRRELYPYSMMVDPYRPDTFAAAEVGPGEEVCIYEVTIQKAQLCTNFERRLSSNETLGYLRPNHCRSPDGSLLVMRFRDTVPPYERGEIRVYETDTMKLVYSKPVGKSDLLWPQFSCDNRFVLPEWGNGDIEVIDVSQKRTAYKIDFQRKVSQGRAILPSPVPLILLKDYFCYPNQDYNAVTFVEIATGKILGEFTCKMFDGILGSPDQKILMIWRGIEATFYDGTKLAEYVASGQPDLESPPWITLAEPESKSIKFDPERVDRDLKKVDPEKVTSDFVLQMYSFVPCDPKVVQKAFPNLPDDYITFLSTYAGATGQTFDEFGPHLWLYDADTLVSQNEYYSEEEQIPAEVILIGNWESDYYFWDSRNGGHFVQGDISDYENESKRTSLGKTWLAAMLNIKEVYDAMCQGRQQVMWRDN